MMKHIRKLNLLLWKNYLIQKRTPVRTLTEFLMPLIMSAVLVILRLIVSREEVKNPVAFPSFEMTDCLSHSIVIQKYVRHLRLFFFSLSNLRYRVLLNHRDTVRVFRLLFDEFVITLATSCDLLRACEYGSTLKFRGCSCLQLRPFGRAL